MTPLNPGILNRRITVQAQSSAQTPSGQPVNTWNNILNVRASIRPASGKEVYATSGFVSELSHVVTIRYTKTPIATNMRVLYGTRVLLIQGVSDPDEAHVQLNLLCLELDGAS